MTFCAAIRIEEGLVGLSDTRLTSGTERTTARKVTIHQHGKHCLFTTKNVAELIHATALEKNCLQLDAEITS